MSIALMTEVWKVHIQAPRKMVLLALADNANDEGTDCFPSIATIVEKCSMSERAVYGHLSALEQSSIIRRLERPGRSSNYILNIERINDLVVERKRQKAAQHQESTVDNSNPTEEVIHNHGVPMTPAESAGVPANQHSTHTPAEFAGVQNLHPPLQNLHPPLQNLHPPLQNLHPTPAESAPITTTEPSLNHNNHNAEIYPHGQELPRGCCGDSEIETSQTEAIADLFWPICSTEERTALSGILVTLPQAQHQILLDELEGARQAGTIRKNLVLFAGALVRAMHNGTFTVGYSPAVAAKRREKSERSTTVESLRTFRPEIAADAAAEGQRLMEKIRQQSLSRKSGNSPIGMNSNSSDASN